MNLIKKIKTLSISTNLLIIIVSLYQATLLNIAYYNQVLAKLPLDSFANITFFLSMPVVVFCVIFALLNIAINRWLIKTISCLFFVIGSALTYFMMKFGIVIDRGMVQNALETNSAESVALITPTLIAYITILGIIPSIFILLLKIKKANNIVYFFLKRLCSVIGALVIIALLASLFYKHYAAFMRNYPTLYQYILPSNYIDGIYRQYKYIQYKKMPFLKIGEDASRSLLTDQETKKTVVVLIVGETARSQNFSLNGYNKETNPRLSKQSDLISFLNASSCGTYTAYSVPCMFSNMTRATYSEKQAQRQENVLDILNRVKIDVTWFDNDEGSKGVADRVTNEDVTQKYKNLNSELCQRGGYCEDQILVDELAKKMKNIDKDSLIVLHTIGSHGPTYYMRYPEKFKKFTPTCDTNQINNCDAESLVNTYDNTINYTDYIVDQSIELLKTYKEKYNTALIYLSDHGESLGENGIYLHSMPYAVAPEYQTKIPFILWLSTGFQQQNRMNIDCLKSSAKHNSVSQDNLFHTLLGFFDVNTKEYNQSLDILNYCQTK